MAANEPTKRRGLLQFAISNLDSIGSIAKLLIPATVVGLLTGWAAWLAGLLQQYAPLSWVMAALVGALIVTAIVMGMAISRVWWVNTTLQKQFYQGEINLIL
jgi:multisubunit Na+/H+ antiporter MnhC subunit